MSDYVILLCYHNITSKRGNLFLLRQILDKGVVHWNSHVLPSSTHLIYPSPKRYLYMFIDLQLMDNQLTGVLPPSLTELLKLINISLQNNKLQGQVPEFKRGVKAKCVQTNSFCRNSVGPCDPQVNVLLAVAGGFGYPLSLAGAWTGNDVCAKWTYVTCDPQWKSVTVLNFNKQNFSGTISPALANLTSLWNLLLSNNDLTGSIPMSLTILDQLEVLDVSYNNLSGPVPNFTQMVKFTATGNLFLGQDVDNVDEDGKKPPSSAPVASRGSLTPAATSGSPVASKESSSPFASVTATVVIAVLVIRIC